MEFFYAYNTYNTYMMGFLDKKKIVLYHCSTSIRPYVVHEIYTIERAHLMQLKHRNFKCKVEERKENNICNISYS